MRCFAFGLNRSFGTFLVSASLTIGAAAGGSAQEQSSVLVPSELVDNAGAAPVSQVAELAPSAAAAAEKLSRDVTPRSIPLAAAPHEPAKWFAACSIITTPASNTSIAGRRGR